LPPNCRAAAGTRGSRASPGPVARHAAPSAARASAGAAIADALRPGRATLAKSAIVATVTRTHAASRDLVMQSQGRGPPHRRPRAAERRRNRHLRYTSEVKVHQEAIDLRTGGRGFVDLTARVAGIVQRSGIGCGTCVMFCMHTSASLMIQENHDPAVREDMLAWLARVAPDGDPGFSHDAEGPDDMPAHVRTAITKTSECVPVRDGRLALGTWQAIYLVEHRRAGHARSLVVTVTGE
jgi:secondary thiamine-phosphate synthase enzyme